MAMNNKYINLIDNLFNNFLIFIKTIINYSKKEHIYNNRYVNYLWNYVFYWLILSTHVLTLMYMYIKSKEHYSEETVRQIKVIIFNNYLCVNLSIYLFFIVVVYYYMTKTVIVVMAARDEKEITLYNMVSTLIKAIMYSLLIIYLLHVLYLFKNNIDILNMYLFELNGVYRIEKLKAYLNILLENSSILKNLDDISLKYLLENTNNYSELKLKFEMLEKDKLEKIKLLLAEENKPLPPGMFDKFRNKYTVMIGIAILIILEITYQR